MGEFAYDLPFILALHRRLHLAHAVDAALGVRKCAVLFKKRRAGKEDVREGCGFVEEQILHHNTFHALQSGGHMLGVGIGLRDIFALDVNALEGALHGGVQHVGNAKARLCIHRRLPHMLEHFAHRVIRHVTIARIFMGEGTHVAGTLHIVLAAQRIDADTIAAHIAREHGKVRHGHDHGGTLAVLSHTQAVIDGTIAARGIKPGRTANVLRVHA